MHCISWKQPKKKTKKHVRFAAGPFLQKRHQYSFDWSLESEVWYSRPELNQLKEDRFEEADILRKERGILYSSRDDADKIDDGREKEIYVGDTITHALDDQDTGEVSVRGIEHFVWPVLQKEMITRKKELKKYVVEYCANKQRREMDPLGDKLAEEVIARSKWARNVAQERGIKYCEMKRGGALLKNTHAILGRRRLSVGRGRMSIHKRDSLIKGIGRESLLMSIQKMSISRMSSREFGGAEEEA
eukprot:scaffold215779_cov23-Cyclotella_meneghiniana.AAC.1